MLIFSETHSPTFGFSLERGGYRAYIRELISASFAKKTKAHSKLHYLKIAKSNSLHIFINSKVGQSVK
jgi:hypothetical protein